MKYPGHIVELGEPAANLVTALTKRLSERGYKSTSPPGVFDAAFQSLVKLFQSQNVDAAGRPLKSDGRVGPLTWGALFDAQPAPAHATGLAAAALAKAQGEVGVMEKPPGSNSGPMVDVFLASTNTPVGNSWCMAFVYWCFREGAVASGLPNSFPKTAGCLDAWARVKAGAPARLLTRSAAIADPNRVKPGFVFILDHGGGHGHTGFVTQQTGGALATIEGNSNNTGSANGVGVFKLNRRSVMDEELLGFLDFG
jgi:hypothetical protein